MAIALGLVIAGGAGRRLGAGGPKALAELAGMTLLARALALAHALCGEVLVCAPRALALPVAPEALVEDAPGGGGPLAGLVAGLRARRFDRALALGVDLPLLRAGALRALGERLAGANVVLPAPGGLPQPLAAWYAPAAAGPIVAAFEAGERSLVRAVMAASPLVVGADTLAGLEGGEAAFLNVNSPEDLALAARRLAGERVA